MNLQGAKKRRRDCGVAGDVTLQRQVAQPILGQVAEVQDVCDTRLEERKGIQRQDLHPAPPNGRQAMRSAGEGGNPESRVLRTEQVVEHVEGAPAQPSGRARQLRASA